MKTLKQHREAAGLTQLEVAQAVGVPVNTVARWERAEREPAATHLKALALALGVAMDDIDLTAYEGKAAA